MGFRRSIAAFVLLASAARGAAEPTEPLTVAQIGDSESKLLVSTDQKNTDSAYGADNFGQAVSEALRLQQQALGAKCRSTNPSSATIAVRWAWEANCRYRRY